MLVGVGDTGGVGKDGLFLLVLFLLEGLEVCEPMVKGEVVGGRVRVRVRVGFWKKKFFLGF